MLLIIDGSSLLSSSYYGNLPFYYKANRKKMNEEEKERHWKNILQTKSGIYTNAVYTMLKNMLTVIEASQPTHLAVVWDISKNTFRKELMNDYKGQRTDKEPPLSQQFQTMQIILNRMGVAQFSDSYYEADDFAGSLVEKFKDVTSIRLYTKDKDYLQLVNESTHLWLIQDKEKVNQLQIKWNNYHKNYMPHKTFEYDSYLVKEEFGIYPRQVSDWKALGGDSSDNIPGVIGIGEQTAVKLLEHFDSIPQMYELLDNWDEDKRKQFFKENCKVRNPYSILMKPSIKDENGKIIRYLGKDAALFYRDITRIKTDIPLNFALDSLKLSIRKEYWKIIFNEYEFYSLIRN